MDTDKRTNRVIARQVGVKREKPQRLGDALVELMENQITPHRARFGSVAEVWEQLLPAELRQHCRIEGFKKGRLKVVAESPSYQFELRLCSSELVKELAARCPRAKVERIEIVVG
jgi:predicted nucleic acid-binding Zn ribbon protein